MREATEQLLQDYKVKMKPKYPVPENYDSDEEYQEALDAYETALYWQEEEAMERYYEQR